MDDHVTAVMSCRQAKPASYLKTEDWRWPCHGNRLHSHILSSSWELSCSIWQVRSPQPLDRLPNTPPVPRYPSTQYCMRYTSELFCQGQGVECRDYPRSQSVPRPQCLCCASTADLPSRRTRDTCFLCSGDAPRPFDLSVIRPAGPEGPVLGRLSAARRTCPALASHSKCRPASNPNDRLLSLLLSTRLSPKRRGGFLVLCT